MIPERLNLAAPAALQSKTGREATMVFGWRVPHYAWIVMVVTFATLLVAGGIRGSAGILMVPLEAEFHWSRATISFAVGVNMFCYGLIGSFAAALMETAGVRRTMVSALAAIGIAILITPTMREPWQFILLWGVIIAAGTGVTATVLAATVATRWFVARRGLVVGLLTAAAAAGQLIFLPALAIVTVTHGWHGMAFTVAAVAFALLPLVALLMRDRPADLRLEPYSATPEINEPPTVPTSSNRMTRAFQMLGAGMRGRDFWLMAGSLFICGASTNGLIGTHLIPACIDHGIPEITGAGLLAGMAIFNFLDATSSGWLSDRMDPRKLLVVYYVLRGLSLAYLPFAFASFYGLSIFAAFYGLDWIATIPATIRLAAGTFGKQNAPIVFGWLMVVHQCGGALAAFVAGVLRMDFGTYLEAFILSGLLCMLAAIMVLLIAGVPRLSSAVVAPAPG